MARYMVIHTTPPEGTQDQLLAAARGVVASMPPGAQWLNSWAAGEAEKVFCEWEADNEEILLAVLKPIEDLFPVETVHLVTWIDPDWYKPQV